MEEKKEVTEEVKAPEVQKEVKAPKYKMKKAGMVLATKYGQISQENLNEKTYQLLVTLGLDKYVSKK